LGQRREVAQGRSHEFREHDNWSIRQLHSEAALPMRRKRLRNVPMAMLPMKL